MIRVSLYDAMMEDGTLSRNPPRSTYLIGRDSFDEIILEVDPFLTYHDHQ